MSIFKFAAWGGASAAALLVFASSLRAKDASQPFPKEFMDQFLSVLVHREWVLASTPRGIYRASPHDKKWMAIPMPDSIPRIGWLGNQEPASTAIYYSAPRTGAVLMPSTAGKEFGLYRFDPRGEKWELVTPKHNFCQVYVRDDWTIYGLEETVPDNGGSPNLYLRSVWMSTDSGTNWQKILRDPDCSLESLLADPDHEGLVCVRGTGNQVGGLIMQADDKSYQWNMEKYCDWQESHYPTSSFFRPSYSTQSALHLLSATLDNYFAYPFGNETGLNAFEVRIARSFAFKEGIPVVVPVEVAFRQRPEYGVTLVDTERGHAVWALNRILPDGTREAIRAGVSTRAKNTKAEVYYDGTRAFSPSKTAARPGPEELRLHHLTNGKSYKRLLNLSEFCDFSKPGRYRVQLEYDNGQVAKRDNDEWVGQFTSRAFDINVVGSL